MDLGGAYDNFTEEKLSTALFNRDKAKHPDYFNSKFAGVKLPEDCPSLGEDLYNKQKLNRPRFVKDKFDEEQDFYDVNEKNKIRLKALGQGERGGMRHSESAGMLQGGVGRDFDRVDQIVDALERAQGRPIEGLGGDEEGEIDAPGGGFGGARGLNTGGYGGGSVFKRNSVFRRSASQMVINGVSGGIGGLDAGGLAGKEFFLKKNKVSDKEYFKNPQKYKDWDEKFNYEDFV